MKNSMSIIGGADGPTSVFVAGKLGIGWLNGFGLILVVLLLIPNIIYAVRAKDQHNHCTNKVMNVIEQVGRYSCMFLMVFNIGITEFGFHSVSAFLVYLFGNALIYTYSYLRRLYYRKAIF